MKPAGYLAKRIVPRPDWISNLAVREVLSVSSCISDDFADYIEYWQHNGFWLFDSPTVIRQLARDNNISLEGCRWFYYEIHNLEYDYEVSKWREIKEDFPVNVQIPEKKTFLGYDFTSHSCGNQAECSPLSCNHLADDTEVNTYCLIDSKDEIIRLVESEIIGGSEPGPYRIFAVYEIDAI